MFWQCASISFIIQTTEGQLRHNCRHLDLSMSNEGSKQSTVLPMIESPILQLTLQQLIIPMLHSILFISEVLLQPPAPLLPESPAPPSGKLPKKLTQPYCDQAFQILLCQDCNITLCCKDIEEVTFHNTQVLGCGLCWEDVEQICVGSRHVSVVFVSCKPFHLTVDTINS